MKYNRICQILGIEKPVIQGPLSWLTDARLVAAVSNAGGLGVLGPNAGLTAETAVSTPEETAEKMREEIRKTKKLTEKPFGVNLIPTPENDIWTPPILQVIKEEGVKAVVYTGYGEGAIITSLFNELKESGIVIIYRDINPTPENTRLAEKAGADIIVATGFDEGGTLPGTALGTFSIVPLIADSVKSVPVMAAGGITDSRLMLTAWICCFSVPCQITTAHSLASWLTSSCRWIRLVQAMKHWPRRWEVYAGCVSACWKVIQMKDTLRWARASEISAASRA